MSTMKITTINREQSAVMCNPFNLFSYDSFMGLQELGAAARVDIQDEQDEGEEEKKKKKVLRESEFTFMCGACDVLLQQLTGENVLF